MRCLEEITQVRAAPREVWRFLVNMVDRYPQWHPDHESAAWIAGPPNHVGSVMRAVETVGGHREELIFELVDFEPEHLYRYRIGRSVGLMLPGGSFVVDPDEGGGCRLTARIQYRFGWVTETLFRSRLAALRVHMAEEGGNLKDIVEAAA